MLRRLITALRRTNRASPKRGDAEKYGRYAYLFHEDIPPHIKYADPFDKHHTFVTLKVSEREMNPYVNFDCFVAPSATLAGNVTLATQASVWYGTTIRGDVNSVLIGTCSNIQDNCVVTEAHHPLSPDHDGSTIIGEHVTVGHGCVLRGCTIENECLVGIGSILTEGSYMESNSMLAAHSVLLPNDRIPSGELWAGNPARFIRKLTEEEKNRIKKLAIQYYHLSLRHLEEFYFPYNFAYVEAEKLGYQVGYKDLPFTRS